MVEGSKAPIEMDLLHPNKSISFFLDPTKVQNTLPPKPRSPKVVNRGQRRRLLINECTDVVIKSQRFPRTMPRRNK